MVPSRKVLLGLMSVFFLSMNGWAESLQADSIKFVANTNVKMFKFTGEASDLTSSISREKGVIRSFELRIPIKSIKTGMDVRDKHMQERIFTGKDGTLPDLTYRSNRVDCEPAAPAASQICKISGDLSFRGETRSFPLTATLTNGTEIEGKAVIDVLNFGVTPALLSYSKISVENQVDLDFKAKIQ